MDLKDGVEEEEGAGENGKGGTHAQRVSDTHLRCLPFLARKERETNFDTSMLSAGMNQLLDLEDYMFQRIQGPEEPSAETSVGGFCDDRLCQYGNMFSGYGACGTYFAPEAP
ncbi:uncharacterized protein CELE_W02B3.3 [Caenorhabditis elegans]|uniref:Uncharacterized protein W02B3.3 n=1 Tax=Caenorhabditis elegans TaxID=6239 RepID=YR23_CAEEL|nr:Uncharacterized protein CELE_W02B3.3 [Caenorhabditis elegans]Q09340.1 RecName: Full=Uncharacterized protein W02B3.3 [Caenorhabditis elegans]CCD63982.1 Uncharacterized protein CELE_W02B3.3 [Caenorhabditis elegans]|eukprot:NP_497234.1 Uncharacterized protein CELE_W02B3.3 [Caenorhabditis elegans]